MTDRIAKGRAIRGLLLIVGEVLAAQTFLSAQPAALLHGHTPSAFACSWQAAKVARDGERRSAVGSQKPVAAQAQREVDAAEELRKSGIAKDLRTAFKKYETARALWQLQGDKPHLAVTLLRMGQILAALHDDAQSALFLAKARQLAGEIADSNTEGQSLVTSGMLRLRQGDLKGALSQVTDGHKIGISNKNRILQASAAVSLAEIYYDLGDLEKANENALESLALSKEANAPRSVSYALYWLGCISMVKRDYDTALSLLEDALALALKSNDLPRIVDTNTQIGGFYSMVGEKQKALETFVALEAQAELLEDPERQGRLYSGLDSVNQELGNIELSLQYCRKTIEMYRAANYAIGEAQIYVRMGGIQTRLGKYADALENYQRSLSFFQENGMSRYVYYVLSDIGKLYATQGNDAVAADYYVRARQLINPHDDPREYSYLLDRIGAVSGRTKGPDAALEFYREALMLNRRTKDLFGESQTLRLIAGAEKRLKNISEATTAIRGAIDIDERLRDQVAVSDLRASYFADVNEHFDFYIDLLMRQSSEDGSNTLKALEISERKRARTLLDEVAISSRASRASVAIASSGDRERKLKALIEAKRDEYAAVKQKVRAAKQAEQIAVELLRLTEEYDQLRSVSESQGPTKLPDVSPRLLTAREIQNAIDDEDTLLLEYSLGEERSFLWAISQHQIESYELAKRSVIEQEVIKLNRTIQVATRDRTLNNKSAASSSVALAGEEFRGQAQILTGMLLRPAVRQIRQAKRLVIVADGALHYVPFAALPQLSETPSLTATQPKSFGAANTQPMLAAYEITSLPSVSFIVAARSRLARVLAPSKTVAIIANPVFEKNDERLLRAQSTYTARNRLAKGAITYRGSANENPEVKETTSEVSRSATEALISQVLRDIDSDTGALPRLFSTQREALEIQSLAKPGGSFAALNFDANRKVLTDAKLQDYRFIHIATHGFFDNSHPELSGIVLSLYDEQGKSQNGFVQIRDIYNLNLNADMVVLSACQTGLGKQVKGEGITGLTRAFMVAGARRVVASLWKVDDDATSQLMMRFYWHLIKDGKTPASALRSAQLEVSAERKWREPFYWAGFFITGEFH